jgi:hypothetical protein
MALVLEAWNDLEGCRQIATHFIGPIPPTDVYQWGDRTGLDPELTMLVARVIRHLDSERAERIASELAQRG